MVEFFPAVFGNPFDKFKAMFRDNHWEFDTWSEDGVIHGLAVLNECYPVQEFSTGGHLIEACSMWGMFHHQLFADQKMGSLRIVLTQPFFFGDLDSITSPSYNSDLLTIYSQLETKPTFNVPWKIWSQDASIYLENPVTVGFRDSWFRRVATPMGAAALAISDRNWEVAQEIVEQMETNLDWRVAAEQFIRMEKEKDGKEPKQS